MGKRIFGFDAEEQEIIFDEKGGIREKLKGFAEKFREVKMMKSANITKEYAKDPLYNNVIGDLRTNPESPKAESLLDVYKKYKPLKIA